MKLTEKQIEKSLHIVKDNLEITKIIKARQTIELIKIPIIIELTNKPEVCVDDNCSIANAQVAVDNSVTP
mgnify:CR=1 FL=1